MKKILMVDDDEFFCFHCIKTFGKHAPDLTVLTAGNGREALDLINSVPVDLVVTDLNMPVMDGYELVSELKGRKKWGVPVMAITGVLTDDIEKKLISMGIFDYLAKPDDVADMIPWIMGKLL